MVLPGLLALAVPVAIGFIGGAPMLGGLLAGVTTSGVLMAIFQSNAGGAWDNAKKMIEEEGRKGTEAHKAAVVGDTVGDPFKDTSGPSLNILLKLMSVVALVIAPSIALDQDEVTAHNMNSIQLSEQVAESTEAAASAADEKTLVIEETEAVSEEIDASETTEKKATEKSEE
jgi:K(+)-stimulated pyrophosphate-energized sodium pump